MNNEISLESLDYGTYQLTYSFGSYEEAFKYEFNEFNKLHTKQLRLPDGKGNIIYLLSNTFDGVIRMINSKNFIIPTSYHRLFYPSVRIGSFMGKRYKINVRKMHNDRAAILKEKTKLRLHGARYLTPSIENIFFSTSDIYEAISPILDKLSIKRNSNEFFKEFIRSLNELSPNNFKESEDKSWNNRLIIIDADSFAFKNGAPLNDNKSNPLYLLYLSYLRNRELSNMNIDMDILICSKNMFIKLNPSTLTMDKFIIFKKALFRIMNANLDNYTDQLQDDEKNEIDILSKDKKVSNIVVGTISPYTKMVSQTTKTTLANAIEKSLKSKAKEKLDLDNNIKQAQEEIAKSTGTEQPTSTNMDLFKKHLMGIQTVSTANPVRNPLSSEQENLFRSIAGNYQPLAVKNGTFIDDDYDPDDEEYSDDSMDEYEDEIESDVKEILSADEEVVKEVLDDIQEKTIPMSNPKTAPISSARDKKLREAQKKVVVKDSTIEEILSRDTRNIPVITENKSNVMKSTNKNMQDISFAYFDKSYINNIYESDILSCFDMLKDKDSPFYITGVDIKDTSTNMDLKETWVVHLTDENKKRHTIKVDIPKFHEDRFMYLNGTKYMMLKQNFYNPLVKDTPGTVIVTTNYFKITTKRKATKSLGTIERIFSLIKKTGDNKLFTIGDSSAGNLKYISSLEYDELSKRIFKFSSNGCEIYFSRDYINDNLSNDIPSDIKGIEFYIGTEGNNPILINEDTGLDRMGRTISEIIENNLSDENKAIYNSIKIPNQKMYAEGKLAGEFIPIIVTLIVWVGLKETLDRMDIKWKFNPNVKRLPLQSNSVRYIRFADGILEYEPKIFAELMLNGLSKLHPEKLKFEDFETESCYDEYIYSQWGSYKGISELKNFYEFLIDPITKIYCEDLFLPSDPVGLLIHAVKLLADNSYVSKASDTSYRTRSIEMIPAILYSCLAKQYKDYVNSGRRLPMTLNQKCVINQLMKEKTVETYSTLNPITEVAKTHSISTKGYKGSNSEYSYDQEKRSYDPTAVGKLALTTSADANVGINRSLVIEPTIVNVRGYREQIEDTDTLKDVNLFSPVEMLTPGTIRNEDPIRSAIASKQSQHIVPVEDAMPALVSNGFDEAIQFHLSDDFVINADEDGQVVDVNEELGFIVVKYKSGKHRAINTKPEIVKNSGGGFYISNNLTPVYTKIGEKFKKDEPLAYHDKYFKYSKLNGLRYAIGPLVKMAFMSSYNTYEDAGICTESLGERMKTSIVYEEVGNFKRNNNILDMVKVGDHVGIGDVLIRFDVSSEDNELSKYLSKLSDENAEFLKNETRGEIKTMHSGKIVDIEVYSLLDPENLSPSLGKIVQEYFDYGKSKKEYLEQFDQSDGVIKAGYLLRDSTEPIKNKYNTIEGTKGVDVKIKIHIEHSDTLGVGDKMALYSANKQITSEIIPKGYEPYSEFRPDEEISVMTSPGTIARRMTPAVIHISAAMKVLIELKRKIKEEIKYK